MRWSLLFLALSLGSYAHAGWHVTGKVYFEGKGLASASVGIEELNITVKTNERGEFDLHPVPGGNFKVFVSHPSIQTRIFKISVKRDFVIDFDLKRRLYRIETGRATNQRFRSTSSSYDSTEITSRAVSVLGFSPNYFTFLPSVSKGAVLFEAPIIRSQNAGLNSFAVDGLVVDAPFHLFGVFQAADLRYVESVEVFRGVHALEERDLQGASAIKYSLPDNPEAKNDAYLELGATQANAKIFYSVNSEIYGSLSARRTYADQLVVAEGSDKATAYLFDYQGKSIFLFNRRNQLSLVYFGLVDSFTLSAGDSSDFAGGITLTNHAHKIRFDHFLTRKQVLSVELSNRLRQRKIDMFDNVLDEKGRTTAIKPRFTWEFLPFQVIMAGVDLFHEKNSASFSTSSNLFQISGLPSGFELAGVNFDSGNVLNFGMFTRYLSQLGKFQIDASLRFDRHSDLKANTLSGAGLVSYSLLPSLTLSGGAGLYHRRPDVNQLIGASEVEPLAPQSTVKSEVGAAYQLLSWLKLSNTLFHYHWYDLVAVAPFVGDPILSSGIYQNQNKVDSFGNEFSVLLDKRPVHLRFSYTYQYMNEQQPFYSFYRPHLLNTALVYFYDTMIFTTQLKVWSNVRALKDLEPDMVNPVIQLDFRFEHRVGPVISYYIEIGQITNLIVQNSRGKRKEYFDEGFFSETIFGAAETSGATSELPLHANFGFIWKI